MKLQWCCARDLFSIAYSSDHSSKVLWSSGLGNYLACKIFAVQTLLWSLEFVFEINLEHDTIKIWNLARSWNIIIKIATYWSDSVWFYSLNNTLVTYFAILSIFRSTLYYMTKYGCKDSQLLQVWSLQFD